MFGSLIENIVIKFIAVVITITNICSVYFCRLHAPLSSYSSSVSLSFNMKKKKTPRKQANKQAVIITGTICTIYLNQQSLATKIKRYPPPSPKLKTKTHKQLLVFSDSRHVLRLLRCHSCLVCTSSTLSTQQLLQ